MFNTIYATQRTEGLTPPLFVFVRFVFDRLKIDNFFLQKSSTSAIMHGAVIVVFPLCGRLPMNPTHALASMETWMKAAQNARRRENWHNIGKFFGTLLLIWIAMTTAMFFSQKSGTFPPWPEFYLEHVIGWFIATLFGFFYESFQYGLCLFPFFLYFWGGIWSVRQRTLWSLIQTSVETQTPLAGLIRAYACTSYSPRFRIRLHRFATALENGYTLEQAVSLDPLLVRYDVLAMMRLGTNTPDIIKSMEGAVQEERDYSPIHTMSILRMMYLFSFFLPMILVVSFVMIKIAPQFEAIFSDFGSEMPPLTWTFIRLTQHGGIFFLFILLIAIALFAMILFFILQTNVIIWRPFGFRKMFRNKDSAKMLRLLSMGFKRNISLPEILTSYVQAVPSRYLQRRARQTQQDILDGKSWIMALYQQSFVSRAESSLLETAQRTGNLPVLLEQLSISKERAQIRKDDITSKLIFIPCLLGFGAVIGVFVVAFFLPLLELIKDLSY